MYAHQALILWSPYVESSSPNIIEPQYHYSLREATRARNIKPCSEMVIDHFGRRTREPKEIDSSERLNEIEIDYFGRRREDTRVGDGGERLRSSILMELPSINLHNHRVFWDFKIRIMDYKISWSPINLQNLISLTSHFYLQSLPNTINGA